MGRDDHGGDRGSVLATSSPAALDGAFGDGRAHLWREGALGDAYTFGGTLEPAGRSARREGHDDGAGEGNPGLATAATTPGRCELARLLNHGVPQAPDAW